MTHTCMKGVYASMPDVGCGVTFSCVGYCNINMYGGHFVFCASCIKKYWGHQSKNGAMKPPCQCSLCTGKKEVPA